MVLEEGTFGGAEVMRWWMNLMNETNALLEETQEGSPVPCTIWGHMEKSAGCQLEEDMHQNLATPVPWSWTSSIQNFEK